MVAYFGLDFTMPTKLFVGHLPNCKQLDLLALFEKYGKVVECDIIKDYGFVHMDSLDDAKTAIAALHESNFMGSHISVEISKSSVRREPGMGNQTSCYKCGMEGHWSRDCPTNPKDQAARGRRGIGRGTGGARGRGMRPYEADNSVYPPPPPYGDPYRDPYYRDRYPSPPLDRSRPYPDPYGRRLPPPPPPRDYYAREYPPADHSTEYPAYRSRSPPSHAYQDPYAQYDPYYRYNREWENYYRMLEQSEQYADPQAAAQANSYAYPTASDAQAVYPSAQYGTDPAAGAPPVSYPQVNGPSKPHQPGQNGNSSAQLYYEF
ncbi:PREDICTED: RNA-binding protein 4.1-like isoform X2 [Priapulus caudatus]|uniref:RNA-binding protein 4.1-like isoform X2 n=1 Tax=Priapulus caudatus TaxID=37621 RepID=A0ABM1EGH0_PRICU|nr:PREDICTED: RNA-binding protein 4.1-like isoform X2 [Priapulus caudatus]